MPSTSPEEELLARIDTKLGQLLRLAALQSTSGLKQAQAIHHLNAAGFDRRMISELLGTTPNTVSVTLAKAKAKHGSKSRKQGASEIAEG